MKRDPLRWLHLSSPTHSKFLFSLPAAIPAAVTGSQSAIAQQPAKEMVEEVEEDLAEDGKEAGEDVEELGEEQERENEKDDRESIVSISSSSEEEEIEVPSLIKTGTIPKGTERRKEEGREGMEFKVRMSTRRYIRFHQKQALALDLFRVAKFDTYPKIRLEAWVNRFRFGRGFIEDEQWCIRHLSGFFGIAGEMGYKEVGFLG